MYRSLIFVYITLALIYCVWGETCGNVDCGAASCCVDQKAGAQCFSESQYACLGAGNTWKLCRAGLLLCGTAPNQFCYDSSLYTCGADNQLHQIPTVVPDNTCDGLNCGNLQCCSGTCYSPSTYVCSSGVLCPSGTVSCGAACYNPAQYNCVSGHLQQLGSPATTAPQSVSYAPSFDKIIEFFSSGQRYPPDYETSSCAWEAYTESASSVELNNWIGETGPGGFSFNQSVYLLSFSLPASSQAFHKFSLNLFVNNTQGPSKVLGVSSITQQLQSSFNVNGSSPDVFPCTFFSTFASAVASVNVSVSANFAGIVSVDVSGLVSHAFAGAASRTVQFLVSSLSSDLCLEQSIDGQCIYTLYGGSFPSPTQEFGVGSSSAATSKRPSLTLAN